MDADFAAVSSGAGAPVDATAFAGADVDADNYADFVAVFSDAGAVRTLNPAGVDAWRPPPFDLSPRK